MKTKTMTHIICMLVALLIYQASVDYPLHSIFPSLKTSIMKTKTMTHIICMLAAILLTGLHAFTQQIPYAKRDIVAQTTGSNIPVNYTFTTFQAPNKMYGFDILKNGKFVLHQPASNVAANDSQAALAKKEEAEKAALFSIEKIKKGESGTLTQDEIKKIVTGADAVTTIANH